MSLLSKSASQVLENWKVFASILLVIGIGIFIAQTFHAWYRLRHVKGPFLASFSKLWLLRAVSGGRMHLDFAEACQKYGMLDASPAGVLETVYILIKIY